MLDVLGINHVGIRISDKSRSIAFYQSLGFGLENDHGFDEGHPVVMRHSCGLVLNLLGPATVPAENNILMDVDDKYCGITHFAITVESLSVAKALFEELDISLTGSFSFGDMSAVFIRDPDRNVIEIDAYDGRGPEGKGDFSGYASHPG